MPQLNVMIQDELPSVIRRLRQPAGTDPRFATIESIATHRLEFVPRVHETWKQLHYRALDELLSIEKALRSPRGGRFPREFVQFLHYVMGVWRRVNDAIAWSMLGQAHVVRRFCHRKRRLVLLEANPRSIRRILDDLNADPLTVAIWNDATSCLDVGDVTSRSWSGKHNGILILEVKEGSVNNKISDLLYSDGDLESKVAQIEAFAATHGQSGMKQLERILRQDQRAAQTMQILQHDRGIDPITGEQMIVHETMIPDDSYDGTLANIIDRSGKEPVLECIDRCLWVFIDRDGAKGWHDLVGAFSAAVFRHSPAIQEWARERCQTDVLSPVVPLDANLFEPASLPILLRAFEPEIIRDILFGSLKGRILLYFDWLEYARVVEGLGGRLDWSSRKVGRREKCRPTHQRAMVIGDQIPILALDDGRSIQGQSKVYRILFEGILPTVVAGQYLEVLRSQPPHPV